MFKLAGESPPGGIGWRQRGVIKFLCPALILGALFTGARPGYAGEITLLAPFENQSAMLSRNKIVDMVVKVAAVEDLDLLLLQAEDDGRVYDPTGRYEKGGAYYVHYSVHLKKGNNAFTLSPAQLAIKIRYTPLASLLNLNFDKPDIYLFHRKAVIPADCKGCHTEKLPAGVAISPAVYGSFSGECYSCHQGMVEGSEWKHFPAATLLCRSCHRRDSPLTEVAIPAGKVEGLCFACHINQKKWLAMRHIHGPVGTGDCTICHDPHGSNSQFQLWTDGKAKLCVVCHEDKKKYVSSADNQKLKVHGILRARGCVVCHSPHATDHRFQLLDEINDLCVSCHLELADVQKGHPVQGHPLQGVADPLRPGVSLTCTSCHNPHGSEYVYLLNSDLRGGLFCGKCHSGPKKTNRYRR